MTMHVMRDNETTDNGNGPSGRWETCISFSDAMHSFLAFYFRFRVRVRREHCLRMRNYAQLFASIGFGCHSRGVVEPVDTTDDVDELDTGYWLLVLCVTSDKQTPQRKNCNELWDNKRCVCVCVQRWNFGFVSNVQSQIQFNEKFNFLE